MISLKDHEDSPEKTLQEKITTLKKKITIQ